MEVYRIIYKAAGHGEKPLLTLFYSFESAYEKVKEQIQYEFEKFDCVEKSLIVHSNIKWEIKYGSSFYMSLRIEKVSQQNSEVLMFFKEYMAEQKENAEKRIAEGESYHKVMDELEYESRAIRKLRDKWVEEKL